MENLSERAMLKHLQKEQERERRRIRDRQRRQSMTVEERERHLARRRRNYQLRRQRAENARLDLQLNQSALASRGGVGGDTASSNEQHQHHQHHQHQQQRVAVVPEANVQFSGLAINGILHQRLDSLKAARANCVGLEVPADELAKLPKKPRLKHIKQLARSLASRGNTGHDHRIAVDVLMKAHPTLACLLQKGLRLTRLKRLARSIHSSSDHAEDKDKDQQCRSDQTVAMQQNQADDVRLDE